MIELEGNIFAEDKLSGYIDPQKDKYVCDYCFSKFSFKERYHYCYYCSIFYCTRCFDFYQKSDKSKIVFNCLDQSVFKSIDTP